MRNGLGCKPIIGRIANPRASVVRAGPSPPATPKKGLFYRRKLTTRITSGNPPAGPRAETFQPANPRGAFSSPETSSLEPPHRAVRRTFSVIRRRAEIFLRCGPPPPATPKKGLFYRRKLTTRISSENPPAGSRVKTFLPANPRGAFSSLETSSLEPPHRAVGRSLSVIHRPPGVIHRPVEIFLRCGPSPPATPKKGLFYRRKLTM